MCSIALALGIGSTIVGGIGQIQQGRAAADAANYNAKISEMNATLADRQARDAVERGAREEQQQRAKSAQLQGRQRAAMAANGVDMTWGSPLDTLIDTAVLGELDALTIRQNAAREAWDYDNKAVGLRADAGLSRANAKAAKTGGYLAAAGTVLGGASQAYSSYKSSQIGAIA